MHDLTGYTTSCLIVALPTTMPVSRLMWLLVLVQWLTTLASKHTASKQRSAKL
jgi:hypothetical protein